jgi:hypothetical protein
MHLQPEFGNWMIEAVPSEPYGALEDPEETLGASIKIGNRRKYLEDFFTFRGIGLATMASVPILGT